MSQFAFEIIFAIVSVLLIVFILVQQKNSSLGSMMGGGGDAGEQIAQTRRGADKFLHRSTMFFAIIFSILGIYGMFFFSAIYKSISTNPIKSTTENLNISEITKTPVEVTDTPKLEINDIKFKTTPVLEK